MKHVLCGALALLFLSGCSNEIANNSGKARQTPVGTSPSIAGTSADPTTGLPVPVASTSDTAPIATDAPPVVIAAGEPGPTALRRLTNDEYRNSVKDLLLLAAAPTDPLLPDSLQFGYENFASVHTVPPVLASQYATAAARVALEANIAALAPCATPASHGDCATTFINDFGKRVQRRPLASSETTAYRAVYDVARATGTYEEGVRLVLETMLQSPFFLYRTEYGDAGAKRTLSSYEVASELSYFLLGSTPDAELLRAADSNSLGSATEIEAQARRLLALPSAQASVRKFLAQWFGTTGVASLKKDMTAFPTFDGAKSAMLGSANMLLDTVVWQGEGTLRGLLLAPYTFANTALAPIYGIPDPGQGDALVKVTVNPAERAGILSTPALLSVVAHPSDSGPIARGKYIRTRMFCQALPPPPPNVVITVPAADPTLTTRERFARHTSDPACAGCHSLIDPVGFGLENYDAIGAFRTSENGHPVDSQGALSGTDVDGPFSGGTELANKLAASATMRQCAVLNAARWAFGRSEIETDRLVATTLEKQLGSTGMDVRELLVALAKTDSFRERTLQP